MIEHLEIKWIVAGLLPIPVPNDCNYYQSRKDLNYAKRTFGRSDLKITASSLEPTSLFHQALIADLRKTHGLNVPINRFPYTLPIGSLEPQRMSIRFRVFDGKFLVLTIHFPQITANLSVSEIIELQILSSHPILESVARFCFNVHYCPEPARTLVSSWQSKPLMSIIDERNQVSISSLVEIVTRHQDVGQRAIDEMLNKNEALNFNDDILLLDKQGAVFLQKTSDKNNQRNRYERISSLFEYTMYARAVVTSYEEREGAVNHQLQTESENINDVLRSDVLRQSVSANRGWELLKKEMGLKEIALHVSEQNGKSGIQLKMNVLPFYKHPLFISVSALAALGASLLVIYDAVGGVG